MTVRINELHSARRLKQIASTKAKWLADPELQRKYKDADAYAERKHPVRYEYKIHIQKPRPDYPCCKNECREATHHSERAAAGTASEEAALTRGLARERELSDRFFGTKPAEPDAKLDVPTIGKWFPEFLDILVREDGNADRTIRARRYQLGLILERLDPELRLSSIDQAVINDLQGFLRTRVERSTAANVLAALSYALTVAVDYKRLDYKRCTFGKRARLKAKRKKGTKKERIDRFMFWTDPDFARLLEHAPDLRAETCFSLGRDAGMRSGEMLGYEWTDVLNVYGKFPDKGCEVQILRQRYWGVPEAELLAWREAGKVPANEPKPRWLTADPKGGGPRSLLMTERVRSALRRQWIAEGCPASGRVLGGPLDGYERGETTAETLSNVLATAERAAGLPPVPVKRKRPGKSKRFRTRSGGYGHLHKLRHSFCSALALRGVPINVIKDLAGHHSTSVTEKYMWLAPQAANAAMSRLDQPLAADGTTGPEAEAEADGAPNSAANAPIRRSARTETRKLN